MTTLEKIGFYGILTNPRIGYPQLATLMVRKGVKMIQLRMKDTPKDIVRETAMQLREIIPSDCCFILNDDPELALQVGADGVHLGQGDMPYEEARALVGPELIIGLSTHNPSQTQEACALGPHYIGVGPVYATPTKQIPDPVLGISGMQAMLRVATVPAVCLGGIDLNNVDEVLRGGAQNICAVRCINQSMHPDVELDKMISKISQLHN